jgi:hypothetical protein
MKLHMKSHAAGGNFSIIFFNIYWLYVALLQQHMFSDGRCLQSHYLATAVV